MLSLLKKTRIALLLLLAITVLIIAYLLIRKHDLNILGTIPSQGRLTASSSPDSMNFATSTEPALSFGQITRQQRLDHIAWVYAHGQQYPQDSLTKDGLKDYMVTFYQPDYYSDRNISKEERNGAVLVFKIENNVPKLIWESKNYHGGVHPTIWVMDVTGDNRNEIFVQWGDGKGDVLFIYKSVGDAFELISPEHQRFLEYNVTSYSPVFNAKDGEIDVADLDGDQIPEISFPTRFTNSGQWGEEYFYVAYKWDGTKYFRWKEQKEPFIKQTQA